MSLYDDLDVTSGGGSSGGVPGSGAASGWSLPMQKTLLLQQQRRLQQQLSASGAAASGHHQRSGSGGAATSSGASGPALAPVLNLKGKRDSRSGGQGPLIVGNLGAGVGGGDYRFNQRTGRMERTTTAASAAASTGGAAASAGPTTKFGANDPTLALGPDDDYNPLYPNEYDEVAGRIRAKRKLQELAEADRQQKQAPPAKQARKKAAKADESAKGNAAAATTASGHDSDGSFHRSDSDASDHDSDREEEEKKRRMGRGAFIAPPTSLIEQDSKQVEAPQPPLPAAAQPPGLGKPTLAEKHNVSTAAANMMAKMGYRHGQGLGREGQGMASALSVEKTSKRGGKIVSELDRYRNPSLVIMLTNVVGPGDVDDELEGEIKEECQKYGPVVLVTIFELPRPNVPAEEAVRIFVEFERMDSAIKAMNELNGRFFGGRTVACRFYDAEKFRDLELEGAPMPLEVND